MLGVPPRGDGGGGMNTTDIDQRIARIAAHLDMLIGHNSKARRAGDTLTGAEALSVAAAASTIVNEAAGIVCEALRVAPGLTERDFKDAYDQGRRDGAEYDVQVPA